MVPDTKPCYRCGKVLPASKFRKDNRSKTGLQANCKSCWGEMHASVTEKQCSRCAKTLDASFFCKGVGSGGLHMWCKDCHRLYKIEQRYKITPEKFAEMVRNGCHICGSFDRLAVDHDHSCCPGTGKITCGECVRGVLCRQHNQGLGNFQDDQTVLLAAVDYLRKNSKQ